MFFHNIDITVCTENSGIANGKQDTSSYAGRCMLMNGIKKNVFIKKIVGREKYKQICTAKVNSNNCNKFTEDAARHTLLLKNSKNNIQIIKPPRAFDFKHCLITHDSSGVDKV